MRIPACLAKGIAVGEALKIKSGSRCEIYLLGFVWSAKQLPAAGFLPDLPSLAVCGYGMVLARSCPSREALLLESFVQCWCKAAVLFWLLALFWCYQEAARQKEDWYLQRQCPKPKGRRWEAHADVVVKHLIGFREFFFIQMYSLNFSMVSTELCHS